MLPGASQNWRLVTIEANTVKVKCPCCGYEMPITYDPSRARCRGVYVRCKGRSCKKVFEIKLNDTTK